MVKITEVLLEVQAYVTRAKLELEDLRKRVTLLEVQISAPAPRRGEGVPPTKLPETLEALEIGRKPRGT